MFRLLVSIGMIFGLQIELELQYRLATCPCKRLKLNWLVISVNILIGRIIFCHRKIKYCFFFFFFIWNIFIFHSFDSSIYARMNVRMNAKLNFLFYDYAANVIKLDDATLIRIMRQSNCH